MNGPRFTTALTEAANRAEATALLIRAGYKVYRPEADTEGEDLVIRTPANELRAVQLKGRACVDWRRYGGLNIWMLFPSTRYQAGVARNWYLLPHDHLFAWVKEMHGTAPKWADNWTYPAISKKLQGFLDGWMITEAPGSEDPPEEEPPVAQNGS